MAGKSHNHTMNIGIKVDASGIGKTNSELKNLSNEVNGLNGKKIDLQLNLSDKASKTIDSITSSIGNMEKSLNSISTKGIQGIQDAVSGATKSINSLTSAIGSVQKSLDGISSRGLESLVQSESSATKGAETLSSSLGHVQTAADGINGKGIEGLQNSISKTEDAVTSLASQMEKLGANSGLMDNWNNSYGGRYGGMRYTGQGKGISDFISWASNGKTSYELTVENAMAKNRNMGIASSWGEGGMDAYWALDRETDNSLMSLNSLAAGVNAARATMGLTGNQVADFADEFAHFGTMVMGLGYTEDVAQTAVMKLGRGLGGQFTALDQYGITEQSLKNTGLWNGDETDVEGYMAAVDAYSKAVSDQLMDTQTGQIATLGKSMSLGGYALGAMEAEWTAGFARWFRDTDSNMRSWTKEMGWGAKVRDNFGNQIYEKGHYETDENGNKKWVVDERKSSAELKDAGITDPLAAGWKEKTTGFSLSTLIIGADQVMSTYKAVKDTILGTFAEIRDIQRMRKIGFKNIFKGNFNRDAFGNIIDDKKEACEAANSDCPQQRANEKKKKKGLFGRTKDKIKNKTNKIKEIPGNIATGAKDRIGKTKDKIGSTKNKIKTKMDNPYNIISNPDFKGYDNPYGIGPEISRPKEKAGYLKHSDKERLRYTSKSDFAQRGGMRINKFNAPISEEEYRRIHGPDYTVKEGSSSAKFNKPYKSAKQSSTFEKWKQEGMDTGRRRKEAEKLNKDLEAKNKKILKGKDTRYSGISNKISDKYGNFKNKISDSKNSLGDYFSADNKKRESAGNKYGGYMKRTNKAIYDTKQLKRKAKDYIKNKKKFLQKEFAEGQLSGAIRKKMWGDKGKEAPYKAWGKVKTSAKNFGGYANNKLSNSALSSQWQSLKNQGGFLKNSITGTGAWQSMSGFATGAKNQVVGNAKAVGQMTGFTPWVMNTKAGQKVSQWKQQGARTTVGNGVSRAAGAARTAGGAVLGGASKGVGAMARSVGAISGLMGGIMSGVMGILGPVGMILMAVTLITGLLDAMGVDWMGPLQKAFGGFIEAMQPAIQGFGTWLSDTAEKIAPALTRAGQILGPIVQALGSLLSGGLEALGNIFGPIFDGIASLFEGGDGGGFLATLTNGLKGVGDIFKNLGPAIQDFWNLMGQGADGVGGFLGGIFDGIGQFITHAIQEAAKTVSTWFTTIANGISSAIQIIGQGIQIALMGIITTIGTAVGTAFVIMGTMFGIMFAQIGTGIGLGIAAIGIGAGAAIIATLGALGAGIAIIGAGIGIAIAAIGTGAGIAVAAIGTGIGIAIAAAGGAIAMVISLISTAVTTGITALATSITSGITMISQGVIGAFTGFAASVAGATAAAYATLLAFQGTAVSLMSTIATDMVNNFKSNFKIAGIVDSEMAGAYDSLCSWGDKIVAKAGQIAADATAEYESKSGIGSPGYIWRMTGAEWKGALGAMVRQGAYMVSAAGTIARSIVTGYNSEYGGNSLFTEEGMPLDNTIPSTNNTVTAPVTLEPVTPPQVKSPKVAEEIKNQKKDDGKPIVYNFNHYGDLDNEERANKLLKYISKKMGFENKRAGRTVNRPSTN